MIKMSDAQGATTRDVLVEWLNDKNEVINDAINYDLSRRDLIKLYTEMMNVYLILTQTLGVKKSELEIPSTDEFTEILSTYK